MRYFDTSALLKRYVHETESPEVHSIPFSDLIVSSQWTMLEVSCVLHRMARVGKLSLSERDSVMSEFLRDWLRVFVVNLDDTLCLAARDVMARYPLKAGDAVQLASALRFRAGDDSLEFVVFDKQLLRAARGEGLTIWDPALTGPAAALASDAPPPQT